MSPRRTRTDWLLAGQDLLRTGGIRAVKLAALTAALDVTTGSFYHHFTDMDTYLGALAAYYGDEQVAEGLALVSGAPALDRLAHLAKVATDRDMRRLDWAMRVWAVDDERAAAAVRRTDATLLRFVAAAFEELGFDRREARSRALLLFSAAVVPVHRPWSRPDPGFRDLLRVLAS